MLTKMKAMLKRNQKTKDPGPQAVAQSTSQWIYIRVLQSVIVSSMDPTITSDPTIVNLFPSTLHLYLIQGSIDDIGRYAGTTVDWIIKVAHSICDPSGAGQVYTHSVGMSYDWYEKDRNADWRKVVLGDTLLPGIYEFVTTSPITLSKISDRQSHSMTSVDSKSSATTFRRHLDLRDGSCAVTQSSYSLIASHLIPKRMGTGGAKEVVTRFVGAQEAQDIHRFHPSIGVLLFSALDTLVDHYTLGFYHDVVRKL
jgi:hypothetical protein